MPRDRTIFLLFNTIHDVLRAEKMLKKRGRRHELVPVPRNLSSDCGMCIRLDDGATDIRQCLGDIEIERGFSFDGETYEQLEP
ncbi:MAG: DUF3343 domain-containing protein [Syntrophorhabdaceae bacterium]|nr:DUF3343 domain-containing protein [Syntrophorhabdaceae bacterium]